MPALELPRSSTPVIAVAVCAQLVALWFVLSLQGFSIELFLLSFVVSGFLADLITGLAHFGFDYVFPYSMPILGPIAREFREHHDEPTLDPSNYDVNFTKGSYGSLLAAILVIVLSVTIGSSAASFFLVSTLFGVGLWAFFFHQIHSYAHMGSHLPAEEFNRRVAEIARLPTKTAQVAAFNDLFETVPIPRPVRLLQRAGLILNPGRHNLHHLHFETDFSSVNGWSDPVLNWFLAPIARRKKAEAAAGTSKN